MQQPLTGFASARLGRKRVFMWSVVGFTLSSVLCGAAQSLEQIILFRLLQGVFGASLVPLSQAVLLDAYPPEKHGSAMAMWGVGVMVGPILGPSLGGLLTEYYNWRWGFYINIPFGILAWVGLATYIKETKIDSERRFDLFGFGLLTLAIGSLQMLLDRGASQNWFASNEVVIEALLCGVTSYMFIVHMLTHDKPFINPKMFQDRNFNLGLVFVFIVGIILLATMALLPPLMQNLMGYPVIDVGFLLTPRGFGTMAAMLVVGKFSGRVDPRYMIMLGLGLMITSLYEMTLFTDAVRHWDIVRTGIVQGLGLGFIFVPLSTITFSSLQPQFRNDGTALFSLVRNIGSSIGISVVTAYLAQRVQVNHEVFSEYITPFNLALKMAADHGIYDLSTSEGLFSINSDVNRQASLLGYLQDFRLMMWVTVAAIPIVFLLRSPKASHKLQASPAGVDH